MMRRRSTFQGVKRLLAITAFMALELLIPTNGHTTVLGLLGVDASVDHAFDRMQDTIEHAKNAALAIEAQTDEDVSQRLAQIKAVSDEALEKIAEIEKKTFLDANEMLTKVTTAIDQESEKIVKLEDKFVKDLSKLIRLASCNTDVALNLRLQDTLGSLGRILGTNQIVITPPELYPGEYKSCGFLWLWRCRIEVYFQIRTPFTETYKEIKNYLETRVNNMHAETSVSNIVETYALIGDLAKRTACFTEANDERYEREFIYFRSVVNRWNNITSLRE